MSDLQQAAEQNAWANGCDRCRYGLVVAPEQGGLGKGLAVPLYVQRVYEYRAGLLLFCECKAGHIYRRYLDKVLQRIEKREEIIPSSWNDALWAHCAAVEQTPTIHGEVV